MPARTEKGVSPTTSATHSRSLTALRRLVARHGRLEASLERLMRRFPPLEDVTRGLIRGNSQKRYQRWTELYDTLTDGDLRAMRRVQSRSRSRRVFSVLVPLAESDTPMVELFADSLVAQAHEGWEAVFLAGAGLDPGMQAFVAQLSARDGRFKGTVPFDASRPDAWDEALVQAQTEYVVLACPAVSLRPSALFLMSSAIEADPALALIYGDDDALVGAGRRQDHRFKPDWDATLLQCQNYVGDLVCFRRSLARMARCEDLLDAGSWGLLLQFAEHISPSTVHHIPHVVSHRRVAADDGGIRSSEVAAALARRVKEGDASAEIELAGRGSYRIRHAPPADPPLVTVIVPTTGRLEVLPECVDGVLNRTAYPRLELFLVVSGVNERTPEQDVYLEEIQRLPRVSALYIDGSTFNFSTTNNIAAARATGDLLCFLNDDTEVLHDDWLASMTGHLLRDRVGAVGAKLLYPNGRIQHAGVVLGAGGVAAHSYKSMPEDISGYHDRAVVDQEVSCVTAACMLVRREAFTGVGGFDEALPLAYNDVDLCLRLRQAGWRIVWTPSARLYHRESVSSGRHNALDRQSQWASEWNLIRSRWAAELTADPFYNSNLSLDPWELWEPAFPPRVTYPWLEG